MYQHRLFNSVVNMQKTNVYLQRKAALDEQAGEIEEERKKMQDDLVRQHQMASPDGVARKLKKKKKAEKKVPLVA
jgi:hypothetical protein